jgi:2-oxo-4-hydroxy-4-carboxy--5-ureidoimidazoline (OHCU) decarboxylase
MLNTDDLNALDWAGFVAHLGGIYERPPWVADRALMLRPFSSADGLYTTMQSAMKSETIESNSNRSARARNCSAGLPQPSLLGHRAKSTPRRA